MNAVIAIAKKEIRDAVSGRWLPAYALIFAALALGISYLGQVNLGRLGFESFSRTTASLLNLCLLLVPLVALSFGAGSITGEAERGSLTYLLAQPVTRAEVILGKFAGIVGSISAATIAGFGLAGVAIAFLAGSLDAGTYLMLLALVLVLVAVMVGLGLIASVTSESRVTALSVAMLVWFVAVLGFDLVIIGAVSALSPSSAALLVVLLVNPVEIVRLLAIIHLEPDLVVLGPVGAFILDKAGIATTTAVLSGALVAWMLIPLATAVQIFRRRAA